ncbi:MAG TPA: hypothetical protein PK990_07225 [Salinivirgaceae bacterium]|nr:hypothetical protein [Salinivirgaceae bacterium]
MLIAHKIIFVAIFLIFISQPATGQNEITIQGCNPTFSSKTITITAEKDFITETIDTLAVLKANSEGCFKTKLKLNEITKITLTSGKLQGVLYAEPGRDYDLQLPNYEELTIVDSLNPYFETEAFFFRIKNYKIPELNDAIANFDAIFNAFIGENFSKIYKLNYKAQTDTLKPFFDSLFSDINHPFFNEYKNYSIAYLEALAKIKGFNTTVKEFFRNKPILYNNPAYTSLFTEIFKNFIPYYADTKEGEQIISDIIKAKSYRKAMATLGNHPLFESVELRELILLKGIHDLLNEESIPESSSYQLLDSIKILTQNPRHKLIVDEIKRKNQHLAEGTKAPDFQLLSISGEKTSLKNIKAVLIYLTFININSFTAQADLETLNILSKKYKNQLHIITIAVGYGTWNKISEIFQQKNYEWTLLDGTTSPEIEKIYRVKASPTCYLLDSNHRLKLSPAPGPNEYFEFYLIKILREMRIEELRRSKKTESEDQRQ